MSDNEYILEQIKQLQNDVNELKESKLSDKKKDKTKDKPKRKQSEYNLFMGEYISSKKIELGDLYDHKKVFAEGAKKWKDQKN